MFCLRVCDRQLLDVRCKLYMLIYIGLMYAKPTCALSFICPHSIKIRARSHAVQYSICYIWPQAPELTNEMAFTRKCTTSTTAHTPAAAVHLLARSLSHWHRYTSASQRECSCFSQRATGTYQFRTKWDARAFSLKQTSREAQTYIPNDFQSEWISVSWRNSKRIVVKILFAVYCTRKTFWVSK